MFSLGKSEKSGNEGQIGFRGIGRLAGLAFCEKVRFLNKKHGQQFELDGKKYREVLNSYEGRRLSLDKVMEDIARSITTETTKGDDGFQVEMIGVSDELIKRIATHPRNPHKVDAVLNGEISKEFVDELRLMLPLPYPEDFDKRDVIKTEYERLFSVSLSEAEFKVLLNGEQLYKNVSSVEDRAFIMIPLRICPSLEQAPMVIGLLWLSFGFVLRSVGRNFGVAVRSRNMLVQGGPVFANEAAHGSCAMTTYGQYLASVRAITGELLLNTPLLSDNSRRDWFKLDANAFQLREQICDVMNGIHRYRYAISRYVNSDDKDEELRLKVFEAYRQIQTRGQGPKDLSQVKEFITSIEENNKEHVIDEKSDMLDIRGYSKVQKAFYKKIMDYLYDYCDHEISRLRLTDYYALKAYVVKSLNEDYQT